MLVKLDLYLLESVAQHMVADKKESLMQLHLCFSEQSPPLNGHVTLDVLT